MFVNVSMDLMVRGSRLTCPIFAGKCPGFTEYLIQRCCSFRRAKTVLVAIQADLNHVRFVLRPLIQTYHLENIELPYSFSEDVKLQQERVLDSRGERKYAFARNLNAKV